MPEFWAGAPRTFGSSTAGVTIGAIKVNQVLFDTVNDHVLAGSGIDKDTFWKELGNIVGEFGGRNKALLAKRDDIQACVCV